LIQHIPTGKFVYGRTNGTTPLALLAKDEVGLLDVRLIIECNRGI
jgi:hypothetical protein